MNLFFFFRLHHLSLRFAVQNKIYFYYGNNPLSLVLVLDLKIFRCLKEIILIEKYFFNIYYFIKYSCCSSITCQALDKNHSIKFFLLPLILAPSVRQKSNLNFFYFCAYKLGCLTVLISKMFQLVDYSPFFSNFMINNNK